MQKAKPRIAVFFGGDAATHDASRTTGYAVCEALPRAFFNIVPIRVTHDRQWQVPLGVLPQEGSVSRMLAMLQESVPAVPPAEGLERLLKEPVYTMITLLRGVGGDTGTLQALGDTLHIPVMGSPASTCQLTSQKHHCLHIAQDMIATPHTQWHHPQEPLETVAETIQNSYIFPLFIKHPTLEGSSGVHEVTAQEELLPTLKKAHDTDGVLVQERISGPELNISVITNSRGRAAALAPVWVKPHKSSFYDYAAKHHPGRVTFPVASSDDMAVTHAIGAALDLFHAFGCRDYASFDMILSDMGPVLLEINTVPSLTPTTPLLSQLKESKIHPSYLFHRLLTHRYH